jgi:hypothetical protein
MEGASLGHDWMQWRKRVPLGVFYRAGTVSRGDGEGEMAAGVGFGLNLWCAGYGT